MTNNSKKGFTLVELSIVLVIIGLLIGGILVAQSMIGTTRIQALVRQTGQWDSAMANFETKFNGLPGDTTSMGCAVVTTNVCGNNIVEPAALATGGFNGEISNVWVNLQQSGLTAESGATYTGVITTAFTTTGASPNSPSGKAGNKTGVIVAGDVLATVAGGAPTAGAYNAYLLANFSGITAAATIGAAGAFSGPEAIAIDSKLDDGVGTTGNVTSFVLTPVKIADNAAASFMTTAPIAYVAATATPTFGVAVRVGSNTGNLK